MNVDQTLAVHEAVAASLTGSMAFPQIVGRLAEHSVERYHADYSRHESTFYFINGESMVVAVPFCAEPIASELSAAAVERAVRQSQRGEHSYLDFVRKTKAAGCVGYWVQIAGRQAMYFGRHGELHVEPFPPARRP